MQKQRLPERQSRLAPSLRARCVSCSRPHCIFRKVTNMNQNNSSRFARIAHCRMQQREPCRNCSMKKEASMLSRLLAIIRVFLCCAAMAGQSWVAAEPVGTLFTYQGQLKQGGSPVDGTADFQFRLFDQATNGSTI